MDFQRSVKPVLAGVRADGVEEEEEGGKVDGDAGGGGRRRMGM